MGVRARYRTTRGGSSMTPSTPFWRLLGRAIEPVKQGRSVHLVIAGNSVCARGVDEAQCGEMKALILPRLRYD